MFMLATVLIT